MWVRFVVRHIWTHEGAIWNCYWSIYRDFFIVRRRDTWKCCICRVVYLFVCAKYPRIIGGFEICRYALEKRCVTYLNILSLAVHSRHQSVNSQWLSECQPSIFDPPPTESTSLNRSPKKFCKGDYVHDQYPGTKFGADPSMGGLWANVWNIYHKLFLCIYTTFWEITCRSDRSMYFHVWCLKRRGVTQGCVFWGFIHIAPNLEGQIAPKPQFWGCE